MPRTKTFIVEDALDAAILLFGERGFHDTTMELLSQRLDLSRSSIYTTFRDKDNLFAQALRRYSAENRAPGMRTLRNSRSPRRGLVDVFECAATADGSPTRRPGPAHRRCPGVHVSPPRGGADAERAAPGPRDVLSERRRTGAKRRRDRRQRGSRSDRTCAAEPVSRPRGAGSLLCQGAGAAGRRSTGSVAVARAILSPAPPGPFASLAGRPLPAYPGTTGGKLMMRVSLLAILVMAVVGVGAVHATTLEDVLAAGELKCGINTGLAGFAFTDDAGRWTGFDVAYCRALAAAVLGDPEAITFVNLTGKTRFPALQAGEIDVLSRNTTWTLSRDVDLGLTFIGVN